MTKLLENTYNVYEAFLEGELNQYDLMSLVEEGIISGEVLESMLEEGFLSSIVLGHHLNNATPADSYKNNSLLQHSNKTPIVKHITDANHTQSYLKNSNKKIFDTTNSKISDSDREEHKKELKNAFKTLESLHKRIGREKSDEVNDEIENKYGKNKLINQSNYVLKNKESTDDLNKPLNRKRYNSSLNNVRSGIKDMKELLAKKYIEKQKEEEKELEDKDTNKKWNNNKVRGGTINKDQNEYMIERNSNKDKEEKDSLDISKNLKLKYLKDKGKIKEYNEHLNNLKKINDMKKAQSELNEKIKKENQEKFLNTALGKFIKNKNIKYNHNDNLHPFGSSKYDKTYRNMLAYSGDVTERIDDASKKGNKTTIPQNVIKKSTNIGNDLIGHLNTAKHIDKILDRHKDMPEEAKKQLMDIKNKNHELLNKRMGEYRDNMGYFEKSANGESGKNITYHI